jgi:nitrite reductase/ring-hydroxylating ferredoxin subunit/uncharacterized membrane protein
MKSQASYQGHPLHPALIVYPFAFLTGAFGFNVAATASRNRELRTVANHLVPAGIAAGLVAAVPGIVDYFNSVPPKSSARERATKHALLNTTALGLFATSWLLGRSRNAGHAPLLLQGVASALMSIAGHMGGTLVYRNQIGVDHRYADAGKWQEESKPDAERTALADAAAPLSVNQMKLVHAGGQRIVVARTEQGKVAFDDRCTHRGGPLSDGALICGTVQCPWHGSQFDVTTGEVKCGPAKEKIETYSIDDSPMLDEGRRSLESGHA